MSVDSVWIGVKKMTNKEAINDLKVILSEITECEESICYITDVDAEPLKLAIKALEKADKYRWHDLRKNPDDLPEADGNSESEYVLAMIGTPEWNSCEWAYYHHDKKLWSTYEQNVSAWRYIEPFEEEEKK